MGDRKRGQANFTNHAGREFVMWAGTVKSLPLMERIRVTAEAGFDALTVTPVDYAKARDSGLTAKDITNLATEKGIKFTHIDPLTRWTPIWQPDSIIDKQLLPFFDCEQDEFFRIAEALGIKSMHVLGMFSPGALPLDKVAESYGAICDRAAQYGMRCSLEFIPFMGIPDLATAWHIIKSADRANSGIIFDTWHFMRSVPDFDLLSTIPGHSIAGVQLADGTLEVPKGFTLVQDCFVNRTPIGEGEFPSARILQALDRIGALTSVGPEIFSPTFDALGGDEIGRVSARSTHQALDVAKVG
jgi:sugar phosphate isomerase/epimerase